ncbi:MAG: hypothetical protein J7L80_03270 [Thermoplasmata archaeon]|nr:hypothetical protein [Thermoplasmata archaeon]
MRYKIRLISPQQKDDLIETFKEKIFYERKANIAGLCIKLLTDSSKFKEMWDDNFQSMSEYIRPHGRIFALKTGGKEEFLYEPVSKTCFILNCNYYGYVKSLALAVAGDFLEEYHSIHSRYSVHGALVDYKGKGTALIAPSGVGKTTHSYGLILMKNVRLVADDWFFARIIGDEIEAIASEKNCYIRADLAKDWKEYEKLIEGTELDEKGRAVVNVRRILGDGIMKEFTTLQKVVLMKRDRKDKEMFREIDEKEALDFMIKNDFCNPHQLVRDKRKIEKRKRFFEEMFKRVKIYMVNTIGSIKENQEMIRKVVKK